MRKTRYADGGRQRHDLKTSTTARLLLLQSGLQARLRGRSREVPRSVVRGAHVVACGAADRANRADRWRRAKSAARHASVVPHRDLWSANSPPKLTIEKPKHPGEPMTYVIASLRRCDRPRVRLCLPGRLHPRGRGDRTLYIEPNECIDCAPVSLMPRERHFTEDALPPMGRLHQDQRALVHGQGAARAMVDAAKPADRFELRQAPGHPRALSIPWPAAAMQYPAPRALDAASDKGPVSPAARLVRCESSRFCLQH